MQRDKSAFPKIKKVLEFAWNSPYSSFYRHKYKKAGVDTISSIKTIKDFQTLPFLTREEIVKTSPWERLFLPREKIEVVAISSGTTRSNQPMVIFNTASQPNLERPYIEKALKIGAKTWLLLYSIITAQNRLQRDYFLRKFGIVRILGDINNLALSAKIAALTQIDTVQTTPAILSFFIPYLRREIDLNKIKLVMLGGESCSEEKSRLFYRVLKNAIFKFRYGSSENSHLRGYRCDFLEKLPPRYFHPISSLYCEVYSSDGRGELIITHLHTKTAFPLIRYRTGDNVLIQKVDCSCGNNQVMELFGRLDHEVLRIQGSHIYAHQVEKSLQAAKRYLKSDDFKIHVYEKVNNDKVLTLLKLQLIPKDRFTQRETIKELISKNLYLSSKFSFADLVEKGAFLPLEIEFVNSFPFEDKQKRIVSHIT